METDMFQDSEFSLYNYILYYEWIFFLNFHLEFSILLCDVMDLVCISYNDNVLLQNSVKVMNHHFSPIIKNNITQHEIYLCNLCGISIEFERSRK